MKGEFNVHGVVKSTPPYSATIKLEYKNNEQITFNGWRESDKGGIFGEFNGTLGTGK